MRLHVDEAYARTVTAPFAEGVVVIGNARPPVALHASHVVGTVAMRTGQDHEPCPDPIGNRAEALEIGKVLLQ